MPVMCRVPSRSFQVLSEQWLVCGTRAAPADAEPLTFGAFSAVGDAGSAEPAGAAKDKAQSGAGEGANRADVAVQPPPMEAFRELGAILKADEEGQAYKLWVAPV